MISVRKLGQIPERIKRRLKSERHEICERQHNGSVCEK